ncbi:pyridoxamine 5'-phosphate oxidase family protein [Phytoactinopolyspora limicola]|uniref:pyridoxamine 5'-phosphate oxidase family protein n=1 Tax=Phytoactinopolyspora limicola TaxID=2715536 RepID=UPI00140B2F1A|nr:pyridoxamine 5'-phosphate oxidase family protein [Phytoactinopolyspora limicola]
MSRFAQLAFTDGVRAQQKAHGSDRAYRRALDDTGGPDRLGPHERAFIAERDSFYLATVGETGWPYIQHRGGPRGFLRVMDDHTLGFADFRGNRQYITLGNLDHDDRVSLFLMDYARQTRLKILGRARVADGERGLAVPDYRAKVEREVLISVEGFDWNCQQHIPQLFPRDAVESTLGQLQDRVDALVRENTQLRAAATSARVRPVD